MTSDPAFQSPMRDIYNAIQSGDRERLRQLFESPVYLAQLGWDTWNQWQAGWKQYPIKELTPLEQAATLGDLEMIRLLLGASYDVPGFRIVLDRALCLVCESGKMEQISLFLSAKSKVGHTKGTLYMKNGSFLIASIKGRCIDAIQLLIEFGFDVNGVIEDGFTPLMAAANINSLQMSQILVDAGADVNQTDKSQWKTALIQAAYYGHQEVYNYLEPMSSEQAKQIAKDNFGRYK